MRLFPSDSLSSDPISSDSILESARRVNLNVPRGTSHLASYTLLRSMLVLLQFKQQMVTEILVFNRRIALRLLVV